MSSLLDLPSELILYIFDFIIHAKHTVLLDRQVLTLESISNKISRQDSIRNYFDEFWKSLLTQLVVSGSDQTEFNKLEDSIKKKTYRRVYCILSEFRKRINLNTGHGDTDEMFKVVVAGVYGVGKTSIIVRYVQGMFIDCVYDPTFEDSYRKLVERDGKRTILEILDPTSLDDGRYCSHVS